MKEMKEQGEAPTSLSALREASRLVNSLVASSYAVRSFPVKWHSIRDKLEKLSSSLTSASTDAPDGSELGELLESITATVSDAQLLADRCCDEHYSGGKLQLRSDLDVVISRLGLHMRRLDETYASGSLSHNSRAIILSRPGAMASRDNMRLYVKDIFSRMRIGGPELRTQALAALNQILPADDERYVRIVACEMADGLGLLVSLLESCDSGIQEEASGAIAAISGFEAYRGVLATAGAIGPLIRVLETGNELGKERAGQALRRMTANSDNSWSVSAQGGVCTLVKICGGGSGSKELVASALSVLRNVSCVGEIKRFMVAEGAIAALAKLSWSKEEANQVQAIDFLAALASDDESVKQRAVREGGLVESLLHILQPSSHCSSKAREVALRAIDTFCFTSVGSVNVLIGSGFLDLLLFLVRSGEASVKGSALKSVSRLCLVSEEAKKAMGDLGFMPELVSLLEVRAFDVGETAAEALCGLVSVHRNRRKLVQDEHNVNRILRLLDPEEEKPVATKKLLLSALLVLAESHSGRRRIVASGYVKNLERLAEKDVADAKKIVKKLSGSRLRNMINGIWSS